MAKVYKIRRDIELTLNDQTQRVVAEVLGISEKHLSQVLTGKVNCSKMLAMHISAINRKGNVDYFFEEVKSLE